MDPVLASTVLGSLVRQRTTSTEATDELSERERDAIRLVASGYTNKEIAEQLGISVKTVETYKARAMEKLGLQGRAALVRYAVSRGWL